MESPTPQNSKLASTLSWAALVVAFLCVSFAALYIPANRRNFVTVFEDFETELPWLTRCVLAIPDLAFPIAVIVIGLAMIAVQAKSRSKITAAVFYMFVIVVCCVALVGYREAMLQPMTNLMQAINGN